MAINWEELDEIEIEQRYAFSKHKMSDRYVSGEGDNPIAFVFGEAPGGQEDIKLRPFIGPAGIVLRDLMSAVGLRTEQSPAVKSPDGKQWKPFEDKNCWLTNTIKFRPLSPGNRTPNRQEIDIARPYLRREWRAVGAPRLLIPIGSPALYAIMGRPMSILKMAGHVITREKNYGKEPCLVYIWPMIHPSFGLRNKQVIPLIERDWEKLGKWMERHGIVG